MWKGVEKNIVYIGELGHLPSEIETLYQEADFCCHHYKSINEFLAEIADENFNELGIELIYIEFIDWTVELKKLINIFNKDHKSHIVFVFENQAELSLNASELNRTDSFVVVKGINFIDSIVLINNKFEFFNKEIENLLVDNLEITTEVEIPLYVDAISASELIVKKPSFSEEIETSEFVIKFPELKIKLNSTDNNVSYSDNKIIIQGDFSQTIRKLDSLGFENTPLINVGIFLKEKTFDHLGAFELSNLSVKFYNEKSDFTQEEIKRLDLIIIEENYIDNIPISDCILKKMKLEKQTVIIFNARSKSKAYQKAYQYKRIMLRREQFSISILKDLLNIFRQKQNQEYYQLKEWDTLTSGRMIQLSTISELSDNNYSITLPFKLIESSFVYVNFWKDLSGVVMSILKDGKEYQHEIIFSDLNEIQMRSVRVLINQLVYAKENNITNYLPDFYDEVKYLSLNDLEEASSEDDDKVSA